MRPAFLILILVIASCGVQPNERSYRTGLIEDNAVAVHGMDRKWRMFVPDSYQPGVALPLVVNFHSTGSNPMNQSAWSGLETLAEQEGFLVATPAASFVRKKDGRLTWNVDRIDGVVDDVAFVKTMIDEIGRHYSIDSKRIYATGFSGGARMSIRVACDLSDSFAAIAPVAGVIYPEDCAPTRPVPVIAFHGKQDRVNDYVHQSDSPTYWRMGVEDAIDGWVRNNGCNREASEEKILPTVSAVTYSGCTAGADVVFYRSEDAGHTWPGSPIGERLAKMGLGITNDLPATVLIWDFFESHPLR